MTECFQNLSNNQLHLEGAIIISKMLLNNCYIQYIKLSGDQLHFLNICASKIKGHIRSFLDLKWNEILSPPCR